MSTSDEHMSNLSELTFRLTDSPTVQEQVLSYVLEAAGDEVTESDIREALSLARSTAHLALASLVYQGVLNERSVGRTKLYAVDTDDPLVRTLKVARAIRRVQLVIAPLDGILDLAILFGSASQGRNRRGSDIDVLLVTRDVDRALGELSRHLWLQPVVMTSAEHMQLVAKGGTFATEVSRGITIWERR